MAHFCFPEQKVKFIPIFERGKKAMLRHQKIQELRKQHGLPVLEMALRGQQK